MNVDLHLMGDTVDVSDGIETAIATKVNLHDRPFRDNRKNLFIEVVLARTAENSKPAFGMTRNQEFIVVQSGSHFHISFQTREPVDHAIHSGMSCGTKVANTQTESVESTIEGTRRVFSFTRTKTFGTANFTLKFCILFPFSFPYRYSIN
jgi:hypothetical protein